MYANDLEPYFKNKNGQLTPLTDALHYILFNLINDYARDNLEEFNTSRVHYEDVVKNINNKFLGRDTSQKRVITEEDLVIVCFPKKDPKTGKIILERRIGKEKLSVIYKYFDKENKKIGRDGKYWIKKLKSELDNQIFNDHKKIYFDDWSAVTNFSSFQWCSFLKISNEKYLIKRITCVIKSDSEFYRFGFKLFRTGGKLFGDGSIQSADNNLLVHIGKNQPGQDLFITEYKNGIRQGLDRYLNQRQPDTGTVMEIYIDEVNFVYIKINRKEVLKTLINKEIRQEIYMLVWADTNEYQVDVKDIQIEFV